MSSVVGQVFQNWYLQDQDTSCIAKIVFFFPLGKSPPGFSWAKCQQCPYGLGICISLTVPCTREEWHQVRIKNVHLVLLAKMCGFWNKHLVYQDNLKLLYLGLGEAGLNISVFKHHVSAVMPRVVLTLVNALFRKSGWVTFSSIPLLFYFARLKTLSRISFLRVLQQKLSWLQL